MKHRGVNIYVYVLLKYLLATATLWLVQVAFHLANLRIFHLGGAAELIGVVWGNVVFGAATTATLLAPYLLLMLLPLKARFTKPYRIMAEVLYVLPVVAMLVARGSNMPYYQYTYRLLSDEIFSYLGISGQMGSLLPHFAVDYWYAWVVPLAIFILFAILNSRLRIAKPTGGQRYMGAELMCLTIGALMTWFLMRGGFGHYLQPADAARYCQPKNSALVNNDAYNILRTLFTPDVEAVQYMPSAEADQVFSPLFVPLAATDTTHFATQRNVVLIIVESLGQEFMGCYNTQADADTRTPFLDSLATVSAVYDGRSNGKKSVEGITAITTALPNLMAIPFTNSCYNANTYHGLPTVLKRHGYTCGFFHGSYNGVMNFDSTCLRLGFDEYLGKDEYLNDPTIASSQSDYDGTWGIFDEPYLQYTAQHIGTYAEPFLAEVFTVSSHHPFALPDAYNGAYAKGKHPILRCVEYTDNALRQFFATAAQQPWYNNTIFIITGDHSGHGLTPEYNDYDGWYRIPFIIFDPQHPVGSRSSRIVQQTDVLPTVIDMLHLPDSALCFGQSLLQEPTLGWQVYFGNGYYCMVSNNPTNPTTHDITLLMGNRTYGTPQNIRRLQAIVQQYNHRVLNDKLTVK